MHDTQLLMLANCNAKLLLTQLLVHTTISSEVIGGENVVESSYKECYDGLLLTGGHVERLVRGARALGFHHAVLPGCRPSFPATLAQNSGAYYCVMVRLLS